MGTVMHTDVAENLQRQYAKGRLAMDATTRIRQRGTFTLPAELRHKYRIRAGDTYRLVDLDGILVLTPMAPIVPKLAREKEAKIQRRKELSHCTRLAHARR